ncbi:MAG TPA: DNA-directed RNA polymerase subunit omega [Trueperaceae bacterium]
MAQEGYDKLLALTDSRYRLSIIVAKRAAQLKFGVPTVLEPDDVPKNENTVSLAMKELTISDEIRWSDDDSLPSLDDVRRTVEPVRVETPQTFSSPFDDDED